MTVCLSLQKTLNGDSAEQSKFKLDPVAYLADRGLSLPEEARKQLNNNVRAKDRAEPDWGIYITAVSKDVN